MPLGRHARLVEEDAAEVIAVGEDLGLQRQKRAARIDQVDARQAVLERDLLRAQVLLHGHRVVRAALDRRVVGDDQHLAARHAADAGDEAGGRRLVVVHVERGQRRQLEKRRAGIEQPRRCARAPAACPARDGAARYFGPPPCARAREALAQLGDELLHALAIGLEASGSVGIDVRCRERPIYQPQQSVLKPQAGSARPRACGTSRRRSARRAPCRRSRDAGRRVERGDGHRGAGR